MTKFSKALAVFVFASSVAFMGFVIMATYAGPNWQAKTDELPEFVFERAGPEAPWTVKRRGGAGDESVGSGKILPEALVAAQKQLLTDQDTELQALDDEQPKIEARTKEARALIETDLVAMKKKADAIEQQIKDLTQQITKTSAEADVQTKDANAKYNLGKLRREEWIIMKNQLEELRSQRLAFTTEKQRLRDLLYQARGNLARAERRRQLLESDGASAAYDDSVPAPKPQAAVSNENDNAKEEAKEANGKPAAEPGENPGTEEQPEAGPEPGSDEKPQQDAEEQNEAQDATDKPDDSQ